MIDDGLGKHWGGYGVCAEPFTSVLRSELHAVLEVLRITVGPLTIHVDNKTVVDGVARGRRWCCDARREGADLWKQIWGRLDEMLGLIQVVKVKAHITYDQMREGRIPWQHWIGNALADAWAKAGAAAAATSSPTRAIHAQWLRAKAWYKWAITFAAAWPEDTASSGPIQTQQVASPKGVPKASPTHELWRNDAAAWCRKCGAQGPWALGTAPLVSLRRPCTGTMADRAQISGRERAIDPSEAAADDGALSFAFLRSRCAAKQRNEPINLMPDNGGGGHMLPHEHLVAGINEELPPSPMEYGDDEDPFGFAELGFDDSGTGQRVSLTTADEVVLGLHVSPTQPRGAHASHRLRRTSQIVWCGACGRFADKRLGIGLQRPCREIADGAYKSRLRRLTQGLHPISSHPV